ncbi:MULTISPECIES: hypothetical protein [Tessaracoccus]|jgi:hypothetical protein|uniref:Uncharacterized protein n=1 Tax=Tessaracoccus lapidicaptus TaxID=1427523 RepID=A0A1C0APZ1_9ACTN|nr:MULTISPECIES: hypothetical protein [Tessaracoccus]AQX16400.1 hypothetical protein BKM78_11140 [Tessaracoccus sp. T2.5-30]OCL36305.1 hypothetical protein BCR15_14110 [Tessaracoccus lapidicaptus]VEP41037.1 hypothetical protein TLA_TLA_02243 [Tessaracoccus lapidicaptus]HNV76792.1 hypothetical protein [Gemmatimonadaceae bacterium]
MKRWLGAVAVVFAVGGVVVMLLPTLEMRWLVDPSLGVEMPMTRHSWFDPLLLGYARFDAPLSLIAGVAGVILLLPGLRRGSPSWIAIGCLIAAAVVPLIGYAIYGTLGPAALFAPILMAASAATAILWHRRENAYFATRKTKVVSEH